MVTYGGESPAKKLARAAAWANVQEMLGPRLRSGRVLVLAGPDNADARLLLELGLSPRNIIAVDADPETARQAAERLPAVGCVCDDVIAVAKRHRRKLDAMVLDFCRQMTPAAIEDVAVAASHGLREGGVIGAAFSYGRESGEWGDAVSGVTQMVPVKSTTIPESLQHLASRVAKGDPRPAESRYSLFLALIGAELRRRGATYLVHNNGAAVFYTSRRETGAGTPMVYFTGAITRASRVSGKRVGSGVSRDPSIEPFMYRTEGGYEECLALVREAAVAIARAEGSRVAAAMYNLDEAQVRAWLAVATRQGT